jgi:hypothetical protein
MAKARNIKIETIFVHLVPYDDYSAALDSAALLKKCGGIELIVFWHPSAMNHWLALMRQRPELRVQALNGWRPFKIFKG